MQCCFPSQAGPGPFSASLQDETRSDLSEIKGHLEIALLEKHFLREYVLPHARKQNDLLLKLYWRCVTNLFGCGETRPSTSGVPRCTTRCSGPMEALARVMRLDCGGMLKPSPPLDALVPGHHQSNEAGLSFFFPSRWHQVFACSSAACWVIN